MKTKHPIPRNAATSGGPIVCAIVVLMVAVSAPRAGAQIAYTGGSFNYSQNFDSLGTGSVSWSDNSTLPGWYLNSTTLGIPTTVGASTGNNSSGGAFNVGVAGVDPVTDRALGWLTTSTTGTGYVGLQLQNTSGANYVGPVTITLTLEQWSARNVNSDTVYLDYKANLVSTGNQLTSPSWTQLDSVTSPNLSNTGGGTTHYIDGNDPANQVTITDTIDFTSGTPWLSGEYLWFRTRDATISGNNDMNAIDNVSLAIGAVPEPSEAALLGLGGLCLAGVTGRRRVAAGRSSEHA